MFSRIALMLMNIHFGGALSGMLSNRFSQSILCIFSAKRLATTTNPITTPVNTSTFFMRTSCSCTARESSAVDLTRPVALLDR